MLKTFLMAIFGSLWERFFPAKTAADQRADDLQAAVDELKAEDKALSDAPKDKQSLIDALKDHNIAILLAFISLTSCTNNISNSCPSFRPWTNAQEDTLAANLATLPPDSPLIAMGLDWSSMRQQIKACNGVVR